MHVMHKILPALAFCLIASITTAALANDPVGRVEKLAGEAQRVGIDGQTSLLDAGTLIYAGDTITTREDSRLRLRFGDSSSLTMGGEGEMVIDEMVLPSLDAKGSQSLDLVEGIFEFISGSIAESDPRNVVILTPQATIGIRGTQFIFGRLTVGMPAGESHWGFQIYDGAIEVASLGGTVILDEVGEGTFLPIERIAAPTPVRTWAREEAQEAWDLLAF